MKLFRRHKKSTAFLLLYLCWWGWIVYRFVTFSHIGPENKTALFALIVGTISISGIYILLLIYKIFSSKGKEQTDYFIFLAFVTLPMLIGFVYLTAA